MIKTNQYHPRPTRRPALAVHRSPAHRVRNRARTPRVPLGQDARDRRRTRRNSLPHARLAIRVHRRKPIDTREACEARESVYAVTSLDAHQVGPPDLAAALCGHGGMENSSHHIRDVTFAEDASTVPPVAAPQVSLNRAIRGGGRR
ncbi:hypothetical protein [Streptomyces sp. R08]|uniref:Transposase n=1 Tax=Streptomyces sp. R08 TaxID=3238624 RepID=A0AB39MAY4_9ACTN